MDIIAIILAIVVMVIGIAGSFLPVLPGIPIIFLAILVYGWYEGFNVISVHYIAIIGALALLSVLIDYIAGIWGAQKAGSSKVGMLGAGLGIIVGIFFGPIGILVGPWVGALIGEYLFLRDLNRAITVASGSVIGIFAGIAFKVLLGTGMLISFLVVVF
ncbi:MAG: DUF456 domain-containing protein [Syntrophomonadaceae bacterium]|jgi:uncharacterized protein YqgC (DUF456 family)|nr:DUF456 domain-containing protein [Syntrophomonadaceae bacterium]